MVYALVGNQNCGKTTLFNQLTGSNQHVGNFPGVTVDAKTGEIRGDRGDAVVDLPGIYSIRPYSNEEIVTRSFILKERPDGIINIVDATNIERNLYLTLQLLEMHIPVVLALNMMDEVRSNGGTIDIDKMQEELGIPVVAISAVRNEGIEDLIHAIKEVAERHVYPKVTDFCEKGAVHRCIHAVSHQVEDHAERIGMSPRFAATKIVEGDRSNGGTIDIDKMQEELGKSWRWRGTAGWTATPRLRICGMLLSRRSVRRQSLNVKRAGNISEVCASTACSPTNIWRSPHSCLSCCLFSG